MKKKLLVMVMAAVMVVATVAGCGSTKDNADKKQGGEPNSKLLGLSVDQQFESRVSETDAIKEEAKKQGYDIEEVVADGDAQTQNSQIETLINKKVAALIVCAVDQNTIETALMKAKNANIPVIAFDRDLPDSEATDTYVGPESITDGKACGEAMAEALANEEGTVTVLELVGALNDQNGIDRSTGWNEGMKKLKNLEVIQMPTDWDSETALEATQNAFQANPDIKGVFCGTDSFIPGVETVLRDLGKDALVGEEGHIFVNGVNGSKDGYDATVSGVADGFLVMDLQTIGETAVKLAGSLIKGEKVERTNLIPGVYYTHEDAEANKDKIWGAK